MSQQDHSDQGDSNVSRRDVLKGATAASVGMVGASAATGNAKGGALTGGCVTGWPEATDDRIDISGDAPTESGHIPAWGDIVIYVHGLFGDDLLDSVDINGANQATAVDQALSEQGVHQPVVAAMWNSSTTWTVAKYRADSAGETLALWLQENAWRYNNITLLGHSLGTRVVLKALNELAGTGTTVDSVSLLGGAVDPDTICDEYETGIESSVTGNVYNYHSEGDSIVCYLYGLREIGSGVGCSGSDCSGGWWSSGSETPDNFHDVDLSGHVEGHCDFVKPSWMDMSNGSAIPSVVQHQF